ncbi:hypothetical protein [Pectobacterium aroidearum]|uniref:hypothetical protein n=1 Tax=Pectobacterium aroidearum TaxID=1201031 RepID=UPI00211440EA|nr:hypothetical protein [Pectobacterium aroidearum]UUE46516.1 hypothetical protein L0Y28_07785 [Pectobacterium aroidearum]UUE54942.1 hypothetical protein L0Y30_07795 [Pectobacterium aroidearum]UUE63350.1 hypothetical protein L0Y29_07785 [Pectobacterium aroidearum]UUE67575.1 hypothetical protein L0Y22_07785 [Pectobacterium aroidearum]
MNKKDDRPIKAKKPLEHINLCITRDFYFYGKFYDELKEIIKTYNDEIIEIKRDISEKVSLILLRDPNDKINSEMEKVIEDADIQFNAAIERFKQIVLMKMIDWLDSGRIVHSDVPMVITIFQQEAYGFNFRKLKIRTYINDGLIRQFGKSIDHGMVKW